MTGRLAHIIVRGRVQGVFFRAHAREEAFGLGLTGWVRNLPNGTVEISAEGPQKMLDEFVKWCYKGPPSAAVDDVEVEFADATGAFRSFEIKY